MEIHEGMASPQRSCYPQRSYSRSTVKRETLSSSPASLLQEAAIVKSEKDSLLQSPCSAPLINCEQQSLAIKSEHIALNQQQLIVPTQFALKNENTALNRQQLIVPTQFTLKNENTALNRQLIVPSAIKSEQQQLTLNRAIATSSPSLTEQQYSTVKREDDLCHSTTTSPGLTTDLENFQDLTEWCRRQPSKIAMDAMEALPETDELNTPLIEHGEEFLFTSPTILNAHNNNITQDDDDCYGLLCVQPSDFVTDFYACADIQSAVTSAGAHGNVLFEYDSPADSQLFHTDYQQQQQQYFINDIGGGETTTTKKDHVLNYTSGTTMDNSFNIFTTTAIPASALHAAGESKCADVLYNASSTTTTEAAAAAATISNSDCFNQQQAAAMFSEQKTELSYQFTASNLETESALVQENKKRLRLDFSNIWMDSKTETPTIDTPEVINTALAMENNGFNLVKFINDSIVSEEPSLSAPAVEDDADEQSQSASTSNDPTYTTTDVSDDEDYEPPWNKRAKLGAKSAKKPAKTKTSTNSRTSTVDLSSLLKRDSCDSEVSNMSSTVGSVKVVRRGRPPKRNISISSESTNADTEVSRYRELRDKNNEASRRSRLNRKMKEQHLEQEATDLETRNRKLKVRVSELEKLVNSMRNNLMQMLLKK